MSIKDLFDKGQSLKFLKNKSKNDLAKSVESHRYVDVYNQRKDSFRPDVDFATASNFARFGLAEEYYDAAIKRVYETYPYDGSRAEKIEWSLSSSYLDLYFLEHEYPKSTGFLNFDRGTLSSNTAPYPVSNNPVYVTFFGGPQIGTVYDASKNRESNIKIDGTKGNTVEFWLKKNFDGWVDSTRRETILDIGSSRYESLSNDYGRFVIELEKPSSSSDSPFMITYRSGSTGTSAVGQNRGLRIGSSNVTAATVADSNWHHYAITILSDGSNTDFKLYIDGALDSTSRQSFSIGPVNTSLSGAIGASINSGSTGPNLIGSAMLSGSLDELRYWKTARTEKEIAKNWYRPVYGGTDDDHSNANLGLYYKFNEGVTGIQKFDEVVLDYSGRINNGKIQNWSSLVRSTGSAIDSSQYLPTDEENFKETGDPILYESNPKFAEIEDYFKNLGRQHDQSNMTSMRNSVPSFLIDDDIGEFKELLQILSSTLDDIFIKIKTFPKIKDYSFEDLLDQKGKIRSVKFNSFLFGCDVDREHEVVGTKTKPWVAKILEHYGLTVTSPLQSVSIEEFYNNVSDKITFEQKIYEVKNTILSNIHKNLIDIFKIKGTESGFRNLIRCFGVDNEILKLNVYSNNENKKIENKKSIETVKQKSLDFSNSQHRNATLYQTKSLATEKDYITGSSLPLSYTMESNIFLPKSSTTTAAINKSSIFGMKSTGGQQRAGSSPGGFNWLENSSGSFEVYTFKPDFSKSDCYFILTSSAGLFTEITSSTYTDAYNDEHWNISVRLSKDIPYVDGQLETSSSDSYMVELTGYNYELDVLKNSFQLSSSISKAKYDLFTSANKAVYAGAERDHFVGTLNTQTDYRLLGTTLHVDRLSNEELKIHAQNSKYFGRQNLSDFASRQPDKNLQGVDTTILRWQFDDQ